MHSTRLLNFTVWYENGEEFHRLKREIFSQQIYRVELAKPTPTIIDAGAHIGLATLYFAKQYPKAHILAIEPHPINATILRKNVTENRLTNVVVLEAGLDIAVGKKALQADMTDNRWYSASSFFPGAWNGKLKTAPLLVETIILSSLLIKPVDLLKLDIEGMEEKVLFEAGESLLKVKVILWEFHPRIHKTPEKIVKLLTKLGFETDFYQEGYLVDWRKAKGLLVGESHHN